MNAAANLYDAPEAPDADAPTANPEALRRAHLAHEAALIGLGKLRVVIGLYLIVTGSTLPFALQDEPELNALLRLGGVVMWTLGTFDVFVGATLWTLHPAARTFTALRAVLQVANLPAGTLLGAYSLWLTLGAAGTAVLSPGHAAIRRATPALKAPGSLLGWIALLLSVPTALMAFAAVIQRTGALLGLDSP